MPLLFLGDADARIGNGDRERLVLNLHLERHLPALGRVLHRVRKKVLQDDAREAGIESKAHGVLDPRARDRELFRLYLPIQIAEHVLPDIAEVDLLRLERERAELDA